MLARDGVVEADAARQKQGRLGLIQTQTKPRRSDEAQEVWEPINPSIRLRPSDYFGVPSNWTLASDGLVFIFVMLHPNSIMLVSSAPLLPWAL